jgi:murein DD-endopeptidase MepM/ murein hydrolase activator NlpD
MAEPMRFRITSEYGAVEQIRNNVPHNGIDIQMPIGTPLRPIIDGTVDRIINTPDGLGNGIVIHAKDGSYHIYGHLSQINVGIGQHVQAGKTVIGLSGNSGHSTGPHLHFAVQNADHVFQNPTGVVQQLMDVTGNISVWDKFWSSGAGEVTNKAADYMVQKEVELILKPLGLFLKNVCIYVWDSFVLHIPELAAAGTILAGALTILSCMAGRGMIKPLG